MSKNTGFRGWFYFRQGWANYFTFIMAATNTLVVTYYLAIERYPFLVSIFPTFVQYVLIIVAIGIPLLVFVGYAHWKKTSARKAEVDIFYEVNPYIMRVLVNTELMLKLNLKLSKLLVKSQQNEKLSDDEIKELSDLQKELLDFTSSRKFRNKDDWKFFSNIDKQN
ncbi:hypothetical protein OAJ97_00195 [Candidatus Nitrosopelagicus sp.]|nr:hypothetical protein [Candidatus Nitrosopelagicus sp.]